MGKKKKFRTKILYIGTCVPHRRPLGQEVLISGHSEDRAKDSVKNLLFEVGSRSVSFLLLCEGEPHNPDFRTTELLLMGIDNVLKSIDLLAELFHFGLHLHNPHMLLVQCGVNLVYHVKDMIHFLVQGHVTGRSSRGSRFTLGRHYRD